MGGTCVASALAEALECCEGLGCILHGGVGGEQSLLRARQPCTRATSRQPTHRVAVAHTAVPPGPTFVVASKASPRVSHCVAAGPSPWACSQRSLMHPSRPTRQHRGHGAALLSARHCPSPLQSLPLYCGVRTQDSHGCSQILIHGRRSPEPRGEQEIAATQQRHSNGTAIVSREHNSQAARESIGLGARAQSIGAQTCGQRTYSQRSP